MSFQIKVVWVDAICMQSIKDATITVSFDPNADVSFRDHDEPGCIILSSKM